MSATRTRARTTRTTKSFLRTLPQYLLAFKNLFPVYPVNCSIAKRCKCKMYVIAWKFISQCLILLLVQIDHTTKNLYILPPDGTYTDKQNSKVLLGCVCLSLCFLAAIHRTKGEVIYCARWRQKYASADSVKICIFFRLLWRTIDSN